LQREVVVRSVLEIDKFFYRKGEEIRGRLTLITNAPVKVIAEIHWIDVYNRIVRELVIEEELPNNEYIPFTLPVDNPLTVRNYIVCKVYDSEKKKVFDERKVEFIVTPDPDPWDDYVVLIWNPGKTPGYFEKIKELGVNAGMAHCPDPPLDGLLNANLRFYLCQMVPKWLAFYHQTGRKGMEWQVLREKYSKTRDKRLLRRKNCLNDPVMIEKYRRIIQELVERFKGYGPLWYDISDEAGIGDLVGAFDFCFSDHCLREFRSWLRSVYGTLERLNEEWGTDFKTWDEVVPMTTDEVRERNNGNFAPWADHRTFMEITFARAIRRCRDWILEIDNTRPIGITGAQMPSAYGGYDWWRLCQVMNFVEPYNIGNNREIIRSFSGKNMICFITLFEVSERAKWLLWYHMLHGDKGVILWDYDEARGKRYVIEPSLEFGEGIKLKDTFLELRGGIVKLLSHADFEIDPIAIHYSHPSIHAHWMLETMNEDWLKRSNTDERVKSKFIKLRESITKLIEDLGLQYNFVSYEQVERGELISRGYKVFIMPSSIAISMKEAEEIKAFVRNGGVLIVDGMVGLMDEHCKTLESGLLDDLFGIKRIGQRRPPEEEIIIDKDYDSLKIKGLNLEVYPLEGNLEVVHGIALASVGGVPAVIVNRYGKGLAIYLNANLTNYYLLRVRGRGTGLREFFKKIFLSANVIPKFTIWDEKGNSVVGVEVIRYRSGNSVYLALINNPTIRISELGNVEDVEASEKAFFRDRKIRVQLPNVAHVYDIRAKKYVGFTKEIEFTLPGYEPKIFALLPYKIKSLEIYSKDSCRRGEVFYAKVRIVREPDDYSDTVVRVDVFDPDGKFVDYYSGNIFAKNGTAIIKIPFALNDKEGKWRLVVTEVISGISIEKYIIVK